MASAVFTGHPQEIENRSVDQGAAQLAVLRELPGTPCFSHGGYQLVSFGSRQIHDGRDALASALADGLDGVSIFHGCSRFIHYNRWFNPADVGMFVGTMPRCNSFACAAVRA